MSSPSPTRWMAGAAPPAADLGLQPSSPPELGALYNQHADAVARWATRLAGPAFDIEDLVHEVFLVALRRLPEFRGEAKVTTWLYEITVRVVQDRRRRQRRWKWLLEGGGLRSGHVDRAASEPVAIAADDPSALELLERKEANTALYQILDSLLDKYRTTLILFELEGLSGQEIATITRTSVSNVWIRLFRARQQFLARLQAREAKDRIR